MKSGLTHVQAQQGARRAESRKRTASSRLRVRWTSVFFIGFCLAFWIAVISGVVALMK